MRPLNRRTSLARIGALIGAAAVGATGPSQLFAQTGGTQTREDSIRAWRGRIRKILAQGNLPIIDTQATFWHTIDIDWIIREMNRNDVAQIAFAPNFSLGSALSRQLHEKYPDYFIPTTADASSWHWDRQPQNFVDTVLAEHKAGGYFLMGEYEIRHYPSPMQWRAGQTDRDIAISFDTKAVHEVFRFSAENKLAFMIHYEIEDSLLQPLEDMLAQYPEARVIWAHIAQVRYPDRARRYGTDYIRSLISRFPNLHFDLGSMVFPGNIYPASGVRDMALFEYTGMQPYGGYLKREWRDLFEAHPERFLAASDIDGGRWRQFPMIIERLRHMILRELSDRSRQLIAYQNAWRLITGEAWLS